MSRAQDFWSTQQCVMAAQARVEERSDFIKKTYLHLGGAILLFVALETALLKSPLSTDLMKALASSRSSWLVVLIAFMAVGYLAEYWARSARSTAMQYAGLALYVVAETIIFCPLLYIAAYYTDGSVIPKAGVITGVVFAGLTASVLLTGKDFSFMGQILRVAGFVALGTIIASLLFGFSLGTVFSGLMVALAAGYILYDTSNVMHHYPIGSHVAAALALFAAVALLFWYILRILMDRR
jgi:FtsH-binding integral membrane protein